MDALRRSLREAPVVDRGEYHYFVHGVTDGVPPLEPEILREVADGLSATLDLEDVDTIVVPEAMGIHHGAALSMAIDRPLAVVRKRSYGFPDEIAVHQDTPYGESEFYLNGVSEGDRVVLVDDVLSSGGTIRAVSEAIDAAGGELVDVGVVLRRVDVDHGTLPRPVTALLDVRVVDGQVEIVD